jgi:hypothetical protein
MLYWASEDTKKANFICELHVILASCTAWEISNQFIINTIHAVGPRHWSVIIPLKKTKRMNTRRAEQAAL